MLINLNILLLIVHFTLKLVTPKDFAGILKKRAKEIFGKEFYM